MFTTSPNELMLKSSMKSNNSDFEELFKSYNYGKNIIFFHVKTAQELVVHY